mgnify:CR=1
MYKDKKQQADHHEVTRWKITARNQVVVDREARLRGDTCEDCGGIHDYRLIWHHVDPESKRQEIGRGIRTWSVDTLMVELDKCILICDSCHRLRHSTMKGVRDGFQVPLI